MVFLLLLTLSVSSITPALAADEPLPFAVLVTYHSRSGNTEKMARAVVDGAKSVPGARVVLKRVGDVTGDDLFASDALIVGSPVYWSNMSGEVKTFFDNWQLKFGVFPEFKMRNKVGAAFATGGQVSSGKEVTMLTILAAVLMSLSIHWAPTTLFNALLMFGLLAGGMGLIARSLRAYPDPEPNALE